MGDEIATQPTQTSWCLLYKTVKSIILNLEQHYGTAIQPVPYNEALHEKGSCYIFMKTVCKPAGMLYSRTSWNAPRNYIYPIAEGRVLCQVL